MTDTKALTANEYTAYEAGYLAGSAARWRERAKLKKINGEEYEHCIEYAEEDEAEHNRLLAEIAKRKKNT
jgi:hypothetical protein